MINQTSGWRDARINFLARPRTWSAILSLVSFVSGHRSVGLFQLSGSAFHHNLAVLPGSCSASATNTQPLQIRLIDSDFALASDAPRILLHLLKCVSARFPEKRPARRLSPLSPAQHASAPAGSMAPRSRSSRTTSSSKCL